MIVAILAHHEILLIADAGVVALAGATATRFWHHWYRVRTRLRRGDPDD